MALLKRGTGPAQERDIKTKLETSTIKITMAF
jgi:hypothetical protein